MPFETTYNILRAHANGDFWGGIAYGRLRVGKSSYVIKTTAQVYGALNNKDWREMVRLPFAEFVDWFDKNVELDWNAWKKWLVFVPWELSARIDEVQSKGTVAPLLVWDDAAAWGSHYKRFTQFAVALAEYSDVIGTDITSLMLTTPRPRKLLKDVRELPGGHTIHICRYNGDPFYKRRYAVVYEGWESADFKKAGVRTIHKDDFSVMLPDEVYKEYAPVRRAYTSFAKKALKAEAEKLHDTYQDEYAKFVEETVGIRNAPELRLR